MRMLFVPEMPCRLPLPEVVRAVDRVRSLVLRYGHAEGPHRSFLIAYDYRAFKALEKAMRKGYGTKRQLEVLHAIERHLERYS